MHWRINRINLLGMVYKRVDCMTNEHYRRTLYSAHEAKEVIRRNEEMMDAKARKIAEARTGVDDIKTAKELGMTLQDYMDMIK